MATVAAQDRAKKKPASKTAMLAEGLAPEALSSWAPPDVDAAVPPVDSSQECPLPTVLKGAAGRVEELIKSLPKFAATEHVQHFEADRSGKWHSPQNVNFAYVVEMKQPRAAMLVMDETRDGAVSMARFPAHLATMGLPALALVFHPYFSGEYEMKCEGMGNWDGYYAWQVRFQQRPEKLARLRSFRIKERIFPLKLKGRAWIAADNFQVLHIDTDLVETVPQIELLREHISVDYRPVHFKKENEDLWLQQSAEVFMDYRGHRYRRLHKFEDFMLFTVDVDQKDNLPKEPSPN